MTPPTPPLGMSDFFGLEAGEYLERLDALLGKPEPDPLEFVRLARALRGSALMAKQAAIAMAAAGLEAVARAIRDGRRGWDAATRQLAVRAVDDLKAALRGLDAGARAFVAREGAAIASALDRAAQALRLNPLAHDPLQQVLRALQPLRGLAALADLPPLPDLLDGIERAIADLERPGSKPPSGVGELFQSAATAIARAAREVADLGRPNPEGPEFQRFTALAVQAMESEPDAVPIASLYHDDAGPHVVQRGVAAVARPPALGRLELVSHGEHLRQAADALERAPSATQRELRAHTLAATFRALANGGGGVLATRSAVFAQVAREVVTSGTAVRAPQPFADLLRRAGELLARSETEAEATLAGALDQLIAGLRDLLGSGPAPAARDSGARPLVADEAILESEDLGGSWTRYQRLVRAGIGPASLDELLSTPSRDTSRPPSPSPVAAA